MVLVASHRRVGRQYAIKVIDKRIVCAQPSQVASVYREREVLASIRHPYIVPMRHAFQTADHLCLVLDYVGGGNMYADLQRNGAYSHERAQFYGAQVVLALEHLHSRGILYRDLKPDNVLLTTHGSIQLADMGWTGKVKPSGRRMTITGTHGYRAPEMYDREYSKPADWWCVGILIVEMLTGENPLRGANRKESEHLAKTLDVQLPDTVLPPARETALASPFFAPIDFDRMLAGSLKPTFAVRCAQLPH
uniref:Protein kinase domain-containing protein n=1 Tax=Seriola lalandi dorsalis TaxID=1841481 RepID=A0A3B4XDG2_SERLL